GWARAPVIAPWSHGKAWQLDFSRQRGTWYRRRMCCKPLTPALSRWERGQGVQKLFDRDRLGEVARLVDIAATLDRTVVGEELQGHDGRDGLQEIEVRGRVDNVVSDFGNLLVTLSGNGNHLTTAAFDLLHVGEHLVVHHVLRRQTDGGEACRSWR